MSPNSTKNQIKIILTKSLFNMREASRSLSLDEFILNTIESLMQIEREEYLETAKGQGLAYKTHYFYWLTLVFLSTYFWAVPFITSESGAILGYLRNYALQNRS